jgi:hypothetical protein
LGRTETAACKAEHIQVSHGRDFGGKSQYVKQGRRKKEKGRIGQENGSNEERRKEAKTITQRREGR